MKLQIFKGTTSKLLRVFILDSSSTTGAGLTGLVFGSSGLTAYYIREGADGETAITLAAMTVGTWATSGFIEIDAVNLPGVYEIGIPNAVLASGASSVIVMLKGATNMAPILLEIQLTNLDLDDAVRAGLTSLPDADADAAGGLIVSILGGLDADALNTAAVRLTAARAQVIDDWLNTGRLDTILDAINTSTAGLGGVAMRGTDGANTVVPDAAGVAPTAVQVRQEIDTNSTKSGYALSAVGLDLILFDSIFLLASAKANWTDNLTTYTNGMAGKRLKGLSAATVVDGTVNDASATTTSFISDLIGYGINFFIDTEIAVEISNDKWQPRVVTAYNTTTGKMTVDEEFISAPPDTAKIALTMRHIHSITSINAEMDTAIADADIATETKQDEIKAKTDSLTFTKTNELDSNVHSVNDVTITGNGSTVPFDV